MSIYLRIYQNLCESGKQKVHLYERFSGLHEHHIIPRHSKGTDDLSNLTYLTVREHIIAHFLLWKIYKNPNDLRSMYMLGAYITPAQRKIIGEWSRDNKIGFHSDKYTFEEKQEWRARGRETQKNNNDTNSFYYWSTKDGQKQRASMGGKAGSKSQIDSRGLPAFLSLDSEERKASALHANSFQPKKPVTNDIITKKLHTDLEVQEFLTANPTWRRGVHWKGNAKKVSLI